MTAKGKVNASKVQIGDRIIVKVNETGTVRESATKTGENVTVARVIGKTFRAAQGPYEARGKYIIETTEGTFEAATIQTMWLAPEDAAGVKRAHVEALAEDEKRDAEREIAEIEKLAEADGMTVRVVAGRMPIEVLSNNILRMNFRDAATALAWFKLRADSDADNKAPEEGDEVSWLGSLRAIGKVVEVTPGWVTVDWHELNTGHKGNDRMPIGEFSSDWEIIASETWRKRADRCANGWHRSAPLRARMLCPECPA